MTELPSEPPLYIRNLNYAAGQMLFGFGLVLLFILFISSMWFDLAQNGLSKEEILVLLAFVVVFGWIGIVVIRYGIAAILWMEIGDQLRFRKLFGESTLNWTEVKAVGFEDEKSILMTRIPWIAIPFAKHRILVITLTDGTKLRVKVREWLEAEIRQRADARLLLADIERLQEELRSDQKIDLGSSAVMAFAFAGIGLWLAWMVSDQILDGSQSPRWPTTEAQIRSAFIDTELSTAKLWGMRKTVTYYLPVVKYTYSVNGAEYTGTRFGHSSGKTVDRKALERKLNEVLSAKPVKVYYKGTDPAVSVLVPGIEMYECVVFCGSIVVAMGAFAFGVVRLCQYRCATK